MEPCVHSTSRCSLRGAAAGASYLVRRADAVLDVCSERRVRVGVVRDVFRDLIGDRSQEVAE